MQQKKAFTLIELMVAMGIIGVLMTMSILGISIVQQSLRNTQRRDAVNSMNLAINTYFSNFGVFPSRGTGGVEITTSQMSINGTKILDLKGPTTASGTLTDDSHTQYCYRSEGGGSYGLGARIEGGALNVYDIQLGNDGTACDEIYTPGI